MVFDDRSERRTARVLVFVQVGLLGAQALLRRRQDWPTPTGLRVAAGLAGAAGLAVLAGAGRSLERGLTARSPTHVLSYAPMASTATYGTRSTAP